MFTFTSVFDSLLFRPREVEDCEQYEEVQRVLREEIVNPLRKNLFVRADRVMKLRHLLDKLSSVKGLCNEEKDPEEFLNSLVAQILRAEPFLKVSNSFVVNDDVLMLLFLLVEFRSRCLLLPAFRGKRRALDPADSAAAVRAVLHDVRHQTQGSSIVSHHSNAALRQKLQNVPENPAVAGFRRHRHNRRL